MQSHAHEKVWMLLISGFDTPAASVSLLAIFARHEVRGCRGALSRRKRHSFESAKSDIFLIIELRLPKALHLLAGQFLQGLPLTLLTAVSPFASTATTLCELVPAVAL